MTRGFVLYTVYGERSKDRENSRYYNPMMNEKFAPSHTGFPSYVLSDFNSLFTPVNKAQWSKAKALESPILAFESWVCHSGYYIVGKFPNISRPQFIPL